MGGVAMIQKKLAALVFFLHFLSKYFYYSISNAPILLILLLKDNEKEN